MLSRVSDDDYKILVHKIMQAMDPDYGIGHVEFNLAELITTESVQKFTQSLSSESEFQTAVHYPGRFTQLRELKEILSQLLRDSLDPRERFHALQDVFVRTENLKVEEWHTDGNYITFSMTLVGPGTEVQGLPPAAPLQVVVMSGAARTKKLLRPVATGHRSPLGNEPRRFILFRDNDRGRRP